MRSSVGGAADPAHQADGRGRDQARPATEWMNSSGTICGTATTVPQQSSVWSG